MQSRWDIGWASGPRPASAANMRVSDAERNEVAEELSKHYGDGRLDQAEFQERLDRTMSAKTRGDLSGLLSDLPRSTPRAELVPAPRRRSWGLALILVLLVISAGWYGAAPYAHWVFVPHLPWLLIALVAFFVWRRDRFRHYYHHRRRDERL